MHFSCAPLALTSVVHAVGQMVQAGYQVKPPANAGQKPSSVRSVQKMFYGFVTAVDNDSIPSTFTVYFPEQHDLAEESRTYVSRTAVEYVGLVFLHVS
jgi:hypothetical protein